MGAYDDLFEGGTYDDLFDEPKGKTLPLIQQELESPIKGLVSNRPRERSIEERITAMPPQQAEIKTSPRSTYYSDNPVLNAMLTPARVAQGAVEQGNAAVQGLFGDTESRKASARKMEALRMSAPKGMSDVEQGASSMLALAPAAIALGPMAGAVGGGLLSGGTAYGEARDANVGVLGSSLYGLGNAAIETITERAPLGILFGQGGRQVVERLIKAALPEITGEQLATLTQDALRQATITPDRPWADYWAERGQAAKQTLYATAGGLGAAGAIQTAAQHIVKPTNQFAGVLDQLVQNTSFKVNDVAAFQQAYDNAPTAQPFDIRPAQTAQPQTYEATTEVSGTFPDEYAGPSAYADLFQYEETPLQESAPEPVAQPTGEPIAPQLPKLDTQDQQAQGAEGKAEWVDGKFKKVTISSPMGSFDVYLNADKNATDDDYKRDAKTAFITDSGIGNGVASIAQVKVASDLVDATSAPDVRSVKGADWARIVRSESIQPTPQAAQKPRKPRAKKAVALETSSEFAESARKKFITFIKARGGVISREAADITGEPVRNANKQMPGLFRNQGKELDYLAEQMHEEGYLTTEEYESLDGGVERVRELVRTALNREYVGTMEQDETLAQLQAQEAAIEQQASDEEISLADDISLELGGAEASETDFMAAMGFTEGEINELNAIVTQPTVSPATGPQEEGNAVGANQGQDTFSLAGETSDEVKAKALAKAKQEADEANKAKADAMPFVLTGSNRAADELAARGQEGLFSKQPAFFSPLARAIETAKQDTMPAKQWALWMHANKSQMGLKDDELQYSGLLDYLELRGKDKVTKAEITDYLSGNGVKVQDVVKGKSLDDLGNIVWKLADDDLFERSKDTYDAIKSGASFDEIARYAKRDGETEIYELATTKDFGPAKFAGYWDSSYKGGIPGTYREILVTLPSERTLTGGWATLDRLDEVVQRYDTEREAKEAALRDGYAYDRVTPTSGSVFKSSHWGEPNVLVHVRLDEVTGADGKRYVRVGEVQSDWGQKGKKEGIGPTPAERKEADAFMEKVDKAGGIANLTPEEQKRGKELGEIITRGGVPAAPFVTDTKAWVALGIKRAIMHALDVGADGVVFGTGQQNADLYDLSKQVDSVAVRKLYGGKGWTVEAMRGGELVIDKQVDNEQELADTIGKELAEKAIADGGGEYAGLDLKVGGEGMRAFYDKIVPSVANDVLKKLGGGKVEIIDGQPGFQITPKMREKVETQGMPLFTRAKEQRGTTKQRATEVLTNRFGGMVGKLIRTGKLVVVDKATELPHAEARMASGVGGYFKDGVAYIVAGNLKESELTGVFLHEVGEHAGMKDMLGSRYSDLSGRLDSLVEQGNEIALQAASRVPRGTPKKDVQAERIAYFIEEADGARSKNSVVTNLLKDIYAALRAYFYRKGVNIDLRPEDFVALAKQSAKAQANKGKLEATQEGKFSKVGTTAEELAKKYSFAVKGLADSRVQTSAEQAYLQNQEMFERMKRGKVGNEDSKAAGERLAAEVGWAPESMTDWMAEAAAEGHAPVDILAAAFSMSRTQSVRLLEAQNPAQFITYTMDVLRTLMATRAYGSEIGRALQFIGAMERQGGYTAADVTEPKTIKQPKKADIIKQDEQAKQTAKKAKEILDKDAKLSGLLTEESLSKALGGDAGIKRIMEAMKRQGTDVDLGLLTSYLSGMVDSLVKEKNEDRSMANKLMAMHVELWRANILTGLFTHEVNVTSNLANMFVEFALVNPVQEMLPGGIGIKGYRDALKGMGGYRKVVADIWALMKYNAYSESPSRTLSLLLDQRDPDRLALMRGSSGSKWADSHRKAIPGMAGKVVRGVGFVPLGIEDAAFKVIPFRYELARQELAGEQRNVTAAIDYANKLTFQEQTGILGLAISKLHEKVPYSEFWITFVKTMTNLIKRGFDLTPGISQIKNLNNLRGKNGENEQRRAVALSIVGMGIASMVMALAGDDDDEVQLSGYGPFDYRKKLIWMEEHDQIGLRIGEDLYPLYRFSPLSEPAGMVIGMRDSFEQGTADPFVNSMYQAVMSKHFMAKVSDLFDGIQDIARAEGSEKTETRDKVIRRQLSGILTGTLIPNIIPQTGDMSDKYKRESKTILEDFQKRIPGIRESLPIKLRTTGEDLEEPRYMSPYPVQGRKVRKDEITRWLLKMNRGLDPNPKSIRDLPHDEKQELLRQRWEFLGYAYEATKDLDKEVQADAVTNVLGKWGRMAGGYQATAP